MHSDNCSLGSSPVEGSTRTSGDGQVKYIGYHLISFDDKPSTLTKVCKNEAGIYEASECELKECQLTVFQ